MFVCKANVFLTLFTDYEYKPQHFPLVETENKVKKWLIVCSLKDCQGISLKQLSEVRFQPPVGSSDSENLMNIAQLALGTISIACQDKRLDIVGLLTNRRVKSNG